jgi:hypothetical protein
MRSNLLFSIFGATLILCFPYAALADSADPEYASNQCVRDKRSTKVCCAEVLDGDKKEIAECVKLTAEKRKNPPETKARRAASTSSNAQPQSDVVQVTSEKASSAPPPHVTATTSSSSSSNPDPVKQATDLINDAKGLKGRFGF